MTNTLFIASAEPCSGKSIISLGLVNMFLARAKNIAFFKPVINFDPLTEKDNDIQTIIEYFKLSLSYEDAFAFTRQEVMQHLENKTQGEMIETIIEKFKKLESENDFTIVEGSDFTGEGTAFEFDLNVQIAKNLGAPAVLVVSGEKRTTAQIVQAALHFLHSFEAKEIQVIAIVANKIAAEQVDDIRQLLAAQLPGEIILAVIQADKRLQNPTMKDIFTQLGGNLIFGQEFLANQVDNFVTGAMQVPNFLNHLKENVLIVTPGDRGDIIICCLQANQSTTYPKVAGIVLTAGSVPEAPVMRLIEGLQNVVPILCVKTGTFETTSQIASLKAQITPDNTKKILLAIETFNREMDLSGLEKRLVTYHSYILTPHMFQYQLEQWARKQRKHIVLCEGNEDRILKAVARLVAQDLVEITLLGNETEILASIKRLGLIIDPTKLNICDPAISNETAGFAETLYELRKQKNMTLQMAKDLMQDVSYFGTMMVYKGFADGMVSGAIHTTQHTIRPALQFIKTKPNISVVSSVFFMCLEDRVAVFGDCAVNPNPNAEQLAEIAISSADTSFRFGIEPRVAMLSYSSGTSGVGEEVEKVRKATEIVRKLRPDLKIEGPIQYDAAVDISVAKQKVPDSEVAGRASVLIFPDLNTGNNTYKAVQRETGALAIGPVLQGLNKPVNDLSRGCTVDDIVNTVIITAIQSQQA